jgi:hypothetical protein
VDADSALVAEAAERFNRERPLQEGDRWQARPFETGWVEVLPVGHSPYAGGWNLTRQDGAVVSISSNPAIHGTEEIRAVIREIGATATPEEIAGEIRKRTANRLS